MSRLERLVHTSYHNLWNIDSEGVLYHDLNRITTKLSPRIIDEATLFALDIPDLFHAINYTRTKTGAAILFGSLIKPLGSWELIVEKQNSIKELQEDRKIRRALNSYLDSLAKREPYMHYYLFQCGYCQNEPYNLRFVDQYKLYRKSTGFFKKMVRGVEDLPRLESPYLEILVEDLRSIDDTRVFELIKGPVYKTLEGLKTKKEVQIYTPRIRFTLRSFKPMLAIPYFLLFVLAYFEPQRFLVASAALAYSPMMYGIPERFDRKHFISPLREIYKEHRDIMRGVEALGRIDELLSFYEYSKAMGQDMVLPTVSRSSRHFFCG